MPTYQYRCTACGYDFEIFQKFTDAPLTVCPECGCELRKVFNSVGIVFKGSGFYSTDSHNASKPPAKSAASGPGATEQPAANASAPDKSAPNTPAPNPPSANGKPAVGASTDAAHQTTSA